MVAVKRLIHTVVLNLCYTMLLEGQFSKGKNFKKFPSKTRVESRPRNFWASFR